MSKAYMVDFLPGDIAFCGDITGKQKPQSEGGHGGWIAAAFVDGVTGLGDAELKIQKNMKGDSRPWADPAPGWTHTVCLQGGVRTWFRPASGEEYFFDLRTNQDLSYSSHIPHRWEILEDETVIVTIRRKKDV